MPSKDVDVELLDQDGIEEQSFGDRVDQAYQAIEDFEKRRTM